MANCKVLDATKMLVIGHRVKQTGHEVVKMDMKALNKEKLYVDYCFGIIMSVEHLKVLIRQRYEIKYRI